MIDSKLWDMKVTQRLTGFCYPLAWEGSFEWTNGGIIHNTQRCWTWLHQKKGKWLQVSRAITEELPADHSHICKHFRKPVFKVFPKDIWQQCFVYVGWCKKHTPHLRAGIDPLLELQTTLSKHVHCYENLQSNGQIEVGPKVGNIVVQKGSSHFLLSIHNVHALISSRSPLQLAKCSCLLIAISYKPWWFTIRRYTTSLDVIGLSDATLAIRPTEEKIILWCSGDILPLPGHCTIQENKFSHHIWMSPETKMQILELHRHMELS